MVGIPFLFLYVRSGGTYTYTREPPSFAPILLYVFS